MEEMKEAASADAADATSDEGKKKFSLPPISKRALILGGAGLLVLALAVAGGLAYRASAQKAKAAAEAAAVLKKEKAAREASEQAEMVQRGEEARRSHREIMEGAMTLPQKSSGESPAALSAVAVGAPRIAAEEVHKAESKVAAQPDALPEKQKADNATNVDSKTSSGRPEKGESTASRAAAPAGPSKISSETIVPDAAGGCTLSGKSAEDYGKALGRCLEEYNRLEGRPPRR